MAIDKLILDGDKAIKEQDFLGAISKFNEAIKENPKSFAAHLKRSTAYQKLANYEAASRDISTAFTIAEDKGKRSEIGLCYFRLGLLNYLQKKKKLALMNLNKAKEYDCRESTLDMWKNKVEYDLKKNPEVSDAQDNEIPELEIDPEPELEPENKVDNATKQQSSTSIDVINKQAPLKIKIREDWYQTSKDIIITIYAKNIKQDQLTIKFEDQSVVVSFPNGSNSEYNYTLDPLYAKILPEQSSYKVYSTKLEIVLVKENVGKWPTLEKSNDDTKLVVESKDVKENSQGLAYPTSSKKAINWSNFKIDDDDEKNDDPNAFFAKLFKDTDEDSRRAMMKSYVESNGTVLTTSWDEAKNKKFETAPPDGMEEKKWDK